MTSVLFPEVQTTFKFETAIPIVPCHSVTLFTKISEKCAIIIFNWITKFLPNFDICAKLTVITSIFQTFLCSFQADLYLVNSYKILIHKMSFIVIIETLWPIYESCNI